MIPWNLPWNPVRSTQTSHVFLTLEPDRLLHGSPMDSQIQVRNTTLGKLGISKEPRADAELTSAKNNLRSRPYQRAKSRVAWKLLSEALPRGMGAAAFATSEDSEAVGTIGKVLGNIPQVIFA